ncbi:MAG: hypothetical protein LBI03_06685 [Clostridiales bacterium]|jgi:ABC-type lipoprotein release transport system permease subunit|nr:hypothetical protein [Clostridiales bacterium]
MLAFYKAQAMMGKVTSAVSGGCLLFTSVVVLIFYIRHYIDAHHAELGILKALGYSNLKIAGSFWVFGLSVCFGTAAGFCAAFIYMPFLRELRKSTVKNRFSLVFFIAFGAFCFSVMTQMSLSMRTLSSVPMAVIIVEIGLVLAFTSLFLAVTTVIKSNTKIIAMMRIFGYSLSECGGAILNGYRQE